MVVSDEELELKPELSAEVELSEELDGIPMYCSLGQDENVFRGQFISKCEDLIGKENLS